MGRLRRDDASGVRESIARAAAGVRVDIAFAAVDALVVVAAYSFGMGLRMLDPLVADAQHFWIELLKLLPLIVIIHITANAIAGAYGHVWEYASMTEAVRLIVASGAAWAVITGTALVARVAFDVVVPVATLAIGSLLSLLMMGLVRFRSRLFSYKKVSERPRILIVGSSSQAARFARQVNTEEGAGTVVGFVNGHMENNGSHRLIAELPVLGLLDEVADVAESYDVDQVVVVGSNPDVIGEVVDLCLETDVGLRVLPAVHDVLTDGTKTRDVRDIEVEDLLVRDPVDTDLSSVSSLLAGRRVLVTGAGGSIGSEVVSQVLGFAPASVWALDRDETLLHESRLRWPGDPQIILSDIRDAESMIRVMERVRPDVIFHAAALKHVPVLEDHPEEAVLTNVIGTRNVIEAGSRVGVEHFVLISTDKAVNASSVMGASKRVAELLVEAGADRRDGCVYTAVRFGNVLGSRGSVIPTFVSQIRAGGPVTVTDPRMTRYFMTVNEAVQLVLQAASDAKQSEVFILDMGQPVRIEELASRLIRLAGLIPGEDITIEYTGARPGEKLTEQLVIGPVDVTDHPKIFKCPLSYTGGLRLVDAIADLEEAARGADSDTVVSMLASLAEGSLTAMPSRAEAQKLGSA